VNRTGRSSIGTAGSQQDRSGPKGGERADRHPSPPRPCYDDQPIHWLRTIRVARSAGKTLCTRCATSLGALPAKRWAAFRCRSCWSGVDRHPASVAVSPCSPSGQQPCTAGRRRTERGSAGPVNRHFSLCENENPMVPTPFNNRSGSDPLGGAPASRHRGSSPRGPHRYVATVFESVADDSHSLTTRGDGPNAMGSRGRASSGGSSTGFDTDRQVSTRIEMVHARSQHAPVAVAVALSQPTFRTAGGAHVPSSTDGFGA